MTDPTTPYSGLGEAVEYVRDRATELQMGEDIRDWTLANVPSTDSEVPGFLSDLRAYKAAREPEVEAMFADLPGLFAPFADMPDPGPFQTMADELSSALGKLVVGPGGHADFVAEGSIGPHGAYDMFTSIDGLIPTWTGIAAQTFKTSFAPDIPGVVWNEFSVVEGLRGPLLAAHTHWTEAQKDVCKLVDAATAALDAGVGGGGGSVSAALGLLGAVVGVVALPFTGGLSGGVVAASFAVTTSALAVAGAGASIAESAVEVSGESPAEIVADLRTKLSDFNQDIILNELAIQERLYTLMDDMAGRVDVPNPNNIPQIPDDDTIPEVRPNRLGSYTMPRPALADVNQNNATDQDNVGTPPSL